MNQATRPAAGSAAFVGVVGIGGIGTGTLIELEGDHTLGRTESRLGRLLYARDYCKLHIVEHYLAVLLGAAGPAPPCRLVAVGNVGRDGAGEKLLQEMASVGIDTRYVRIEPDFSTLFSVSFLYPDKSGGNITISNSAAAAFDSAQLDACRNELEAFGSRGIAVCLPEVPVAARSHFLRIATECHSLRVASFTAGEMHEVRRLKLLSEVDLLALNREEAAALGGEAAESMDRGEVLKRCLEAASSMNPAIRLVVTSGHEGADVFDGAWSHHSALPVDVISSAGAGDALLAGVIAGLVKGLPLVDQRPEGTTCSAIGLGRLVAAFSLTSPHTIHPGFSIDALRDFAAARDIRFDASQTPDASTTGLHNREHRAGVSR